MRLSLLTLSLVCACLALIATRLPAGEDTPGLLPKATDVVVCLGDSITDGCTYTQLISQALKDAGMPVPTVVCSGVVCDTAPLMAARMNKTVLSFQPTIVTLAAGTNDAIHGEAPEIYEKALREIADRVKAQGARMILLTPCIIDVKGKDKREPAEKLVALYAEAIRKVAKEYGFAVAENNALQNKARDDGKAVMSPDGIHPNYFGQTLMARSILDAMGCQEVPLPKEFKPQLFPGVIREWRLRLAPKAADGKAQPLTEEVVKGLAVDDTWKTFALPDPEPNDKRSAEDWNEQERRNGFSYAVKEINKEGAIHLSATIDAKEAKKAWINTATGISKAFWNGKDVTPAETNDEEKPCLRGYHAGKHRIPVEMQAGKNVLVIEVGQGQEFFCSVTDKMVWEAELR